MKGIFLGNITFEIPPNRDFEKKKLFCGFITTNCFRSNHYNLSYN